MSAFLITEPGATSCTLCSSGSYYGSTGTVTATDPFFHMSSLRLCVCAYVFVYLCSHISNGSACSSRCFADRDHTLAGASACTLCGSGSYYSSTGMCALVNLEMTEHWMLYYPNQNFLYIIVHIQSTLRFWLFLGEEY
jgi:hypothetical protein